MKKSFRWRIFLLCFLFSQSFAQWQTPVNLGPNINTTGEDKGPDISHDAKKIYFWSTAAGSGNDLFFSDWDSVNNQWGPRVNLGAPINTNYNEIGPCISADGHRLYFASDRGGGYGMYDIYVARSNGSSWDSVTNLGPNINDSGNDIGPDISADGATLFFSIGWLSPPNNEEIVISSDSSGQWLPHVGWDKNTSDIEDNPNLTYGGDTLYFCSDRSGGSGLLDIWFSTRVAGSWQDPVNIGAIINTSEVDANPSITDDGKAIFFSTRNRPGGFGDWDIWVSYSNVGVAEASSRLPVEIFKVEPNPSQGRVMIKFQLTDYHLPVNLEIYDGVGQLVKNLAPVPDGSALSEVIWNGRDESGLAAPAGVYFITLQFTKHCAVKKIILFR